MYSILSGIDNLHLADAVLKDRRVGLMTNQTGIDAHFHTTIDLLRERYRLASLFAVEHGLRGCAQAGEDFESSTDVRTGLPIFSVYGKTRRLTKEMLDTFDVFCFDMQDVGLRFYTYLYALSYAMEECWHAGKDVVVFDRVNPLGGARVEGTMLDERFASYVGMYALPTRYGMTIGEYALWVKDHLHMDTLRLTVIPLGGWNRADTLDKLNLPWPAPSPGCPMFHTALAYSGTCLFEGVNVSEGRGTCMPFEYVGAPWIDAQKLAERMRRRALPGLFFRENYFTPAFSKYGGEMCGGVQMHILDQDAASPILGALTLLDEIRDLYPDRLEFLRFENNEVYTIDRLLGTDAYRAGRMEAHALLDAHESAVRQFEEARKPYLLY